MHGMSTVLSLTEFAYILIIIINFSLSDKFGKIYFDIY